MLCGRLEASGDGGGKATAGGARAAATPDGVSMDTDRAVSIWSQLLASVASFNTAIGHCVPTIWLRI